MKEFCLVHLSDLHMSRSGDAVEKRVLASLVDDLLELERQQGIDIQAIAVTGDSIDKGDVEAFPLATSYFRTLLERLDLAPSRLFIVPGNHDAPRRTAVQLLVGQLAPSDLQRADRAAEYWETLEPRFRPYSSYIRDLVNNSSWTPGPLGSYVSDCVLTDGRVRFVMLNSAWSTVGDGDEGKLLLGRWQVEGLSESCRELPKPDFAIALMHHPLNWLHRDEREMLVECLGPQRLNVNVMLHGHIHTGSADLLSTPDQSLTTLVSGIGYPTIKERDHGQPKGSDCRYAVYRFNVEDGTVRVWLRVTRRDGTFVADTSLYRAGKDTGSFTLRFRVPQTTQIMAAAVIDTQLDDVRVDPVPVADGWIGRENELQALLEAGLRAVAITGVGGQGKTALAAAFLHKHSGSPTSRFSSGVWVNCRELPDTLHAKILEVLEALTGGKESAELYRDERPEDTASRLVKHLQRRSILMVLDNVDAYVDRQTERPRDELSTILDAILSTPHTSLVLLTCRLPLIDSRASFRHLPLTGLSVEDGIQFFRARNIDLSGNNDTRYCARVVGLTNGHPWWLGLIAGQIQSRQETMMGYASKFRGGEVVKQYFQDIWKQTNRDRQKILRHLIEAHRPLNEGEIAVAVRDFGPAKVSQELRRMVRLGLLEPHQGTGRTSETYYHVHPLVREFVHESYRPSEQRPYVTHVLYVFIPKSMVDAVFAGSGSPPGQQVGVSTQGIVDAVHTCLTSRHYDQALLLLKWYWRTFLKTGYHHYLSLFAGQLLDNINWERANLFDRMGLYLLLGIYDHLSQKGDRRHSRYLIRLRSMAEPGTEANVVFLVSAGSDLWRSGKHKEAIKHFDMAEAVVASLPDKNFINITQLHHARALALRDSGRYREALSVFKDTSIHRADDDEVGLAADMGNVARCLTKMGHLDEAEILLCHSISLLAKSNNYQARANLGYGYSWLAETCFSRDRKELGVALLALAEEVWIEYAPGLLWQINDIRKARGLKSATVDAKSKDARMIATQFMTETLQSSQVGSGREVMERVLNMILEE